MAYKGLGQLTAEDIAAAGVASHEAASLRAELSRIIRQHRGSPPETWAAISRRLLRPDLPFAVHQMMYYGCYKDYDSKTAPAWIPDKESAVSTNIGLILQKHGKEFLGSRYSDPFTSFCDFQRFSASNPDTYWKMVFEEIGIKFSVPPTCILREDSSCPGGQWLPDAYLNPAGNCLSVNAKRSLDDVMIIWRDEGYDTLPLHHMTLKELREEVWLVARAIDLLGLKKGSAIAIDMPMSATAVVIYLAIVLAGYMVVSIADSFAPSEISTRLKISNAKAIFTQDYIFRGNKKLPLYCKVIEAQAPSAVVFTSRGSEVIKGLRHNDISWDEFLGRVKHTKGINYAALEQPISSFTNILFSSGTTGEPKAIPWTNAVPLKASSDAWAHLDVHKGDIVAWPTSLGWMMGPWIIYAALLNGACLALYNGSPLGAGFAKFVQDAKVTMLGVVPSIVRAWKNKNTTAGFDWSVIRCFSSSGEVSNPDEYLWLMGRAHYKPVIEICGGTEVGGGFISGSLLQAQALSAFSTPVMGCKLCILGPDGNPLDEDVPGIGELALDPTILGASTTLLNANHYDVYFRGMPKLNGKLLRRHGDEFERTADGYFKAHGRVDDTMNLGGIKVSSVEIERICNGVDDAILETAAVGVPLTGGGPEQLVVAVVFKDQNLLGEKLDQLRLKCNAALQKNLNPLFKVSHIVPVPSLPRTASNKVMRRVLRQQLLGRAKL